MTGNPLPDADRAVVPDNKLVEYLLSGAHPDGHGKARFFASFGFSVAGWRVLAEALSRHAAENSVVEQSATAFGTRYIVEGILWAPDGRTPEVPVVWFIDRGGGAPRLVTAYRVRRR